MFEQLDTASCNASEAPLATQVNKSDKPGVRPSHAFMFEVAVWYSLARAHCTAVVALSASQNHPTRWAVSAGLTDDGSLMPSTIGCRPFVGNEKGAGLAVSGECENLRLLAFLSCSCSEAHARFLAPQLAAVEASMSYHHASIVLRHILSMHGPQAELSLAKQLPRALPNQHVCAALLPCAANYTVWALHGTPVSAHSSTGAGVMCIAVQCPPHVGIQGATLCSSMSPSHGVLFMHL